MKKLSVIFICLFLSVTSQARVITVDDDGPADFNNIQAAINDANDEDTVVVADGIYTGNGNRDIDFLGKAITVKSKNGPENCIIDCNGTYEENHRGFYFHNNEDANSTAAGFTIINGYASGNWPEDAGGAIHCFDASPVIKNCIVSDNSADSGGGIYCYYSNNATITNCVITENVATIGGGICCHVGMMNIAFNDVIITNCTFYANTATYGGAVYIGEGSNPSMANCILRGDNAPYGPEIAMTTLDWGSAASISYSNVQGGQAAIYDIAVLYWGPGNIDNAPCFAENGDYHLQSAAGRWDPNSESWVIDANTSIAIDTGNPCCPLGDEPNSVQNVRINMGAYGGTSQASKTPIGWGLLADLNNDRTVNFVDLAEFAQRWLEGGDCISSDLSRNGFVDFADLFLLTEGWPNCACIPEEEAEIEKASLSSYYTADNNSVEPNAPGYTLPLDMCDVWNYDYMDFFFPMSSLSPFIEQNGFVVLNGYEWPPVVGAIPPDDIDEGFTTVYEQLRRMEVMLFITSDTLLHIYHVQFDETLKEIEENEFIADINALTKALLAVAIDQYDSYSGDLQEAAKRNVAYLSVANKLIDPNSEVPAFVADTVASELAKIEAHEGFDNSPLFIYKEDYSQYVPRGHYTRSEALKRYFKTVMWYGRMAFLLKGSVNWGQDEFNDALISIYDAKIQTFQAIMLAESIEQVTVGQRTGREIWDRLYVVTAFYVGLADDLTPYEYIEVINRLFCNGFDLSELVDEETYFGVKSELALLRSPQIYGGTGKIWLYPPYTPDELDELLDKIKGMRFMGQRFIPDSYIFQNLVYPEVLCPFSGCYTLPDPVPFTLAETGDDTFTRGYPRGLDVMAILGSNQAETILAAEGDANYVNYATKYNELKDQFDAFDVNDWNRNLYWGWLYSLRSLLGEFEEGYPNFMRTTAWERKELNAALASWTELRHDTILYAKQSYTPPGKGGVPPPPDASGYVEPVPEFYRRLLALTNMTQEGLTALDALSPEANSRLESFKDILSELIEIADKELLNQPLSSEDFEYIADFAETLEETITGVDGEGISTVLVADVHTHCYEEKVVEEGVGYIDLMIIACPLSNGSIILSAGPVFSYYEFKQPMSDRLTDEAWRALLDSPDKPDKPTWFQPFVVMY